MDFKYNQNFIAHTNLVTKNRLHLIPSEAAIDALLSMGRQGLLETELRRPMVRDAPTSSPSSDNWLDPSLVGPTSRHSSTGGGISADAFTWRKYKQAPQSQVKAWGSHPDTAGFWALNPIDFPQLKRSL